MSWDRRLGQYDVRTKLLDHLNSLLALKHGERPFPISAEIHVSNLCNHRCHFCEAAEFLQTDHVLLETDLVKKVLVELKDLGIQGIVWSGGGEPLVHPDFFDILRESWALGIANGLITNFSLVKPQNIPPLIEQLAWMRISMNAGDRQRYYKVHGVDHFDQVCENISLLSQENHKKGSPLPMSLSMVYTKENLETAVDLVRQAIGLQVQSVHLRPDQFIQDIPWLTSDVVKHVLQDARTLPQQMGSPLQVSTSEYMEQQYLETYPSTCYAHFFTLSITADGEVNFCKSRFDRPETNYGNIRHASMREIWNSHRVKVLEKQIHPRDCAGYCRQMHVNVHVDDILSIPGELDTRFI